MSGCPALFLQSAVVAAALLPPPPSPTTTRQPASQPTQPGTHQRTRKKKQGQRRSLDTRSAGRRYEGKVRHVGGDDIDSETVGGSVGLAGTGRLSRTVASPCVQRCPRLANSHTAGQHFTRACCRVFETFPRTSNGSGGRKQQG